MDARKTLGITFGDEVRVAGLPGIGWDSEGTLFGIEDWTDEQLTLLQTVIDAHDPNDVPLNLARSIVDVAMAKLVIDADGNVQGLEQSSCVAGVFSMMPGYLICMFSTAQADANYSVFALASGLNVDVGDQQPDYFELIVRDRTTQELTNPITLDFFVKRIN